MFNTKAVKTKLLLKHNVNPDKDMIITINLSTSQDTEQSAINHFSDALSNM